MAHASVDTFDITLQYPLEVELFRDGIISGVSASMMQHRQRLSSVFPTEKREVRRFSVVIEDAPVADYHRAVTLWETTLGGCEPLDITLRGTDYDSGAAATETIQVRIKDHPMILRSKSPMHYTFKFVLEEFGHAP